MSYPFRIVCGFFNVPHIELINMDGICETVPTVYSPYPRRPESLTIFRCNCKGSTFSSVILRPWVLVRPYSNSRPPAEQPDAQPTEPLVRGKSIKGMFRMANHWLIIAILLFKLIGSSKVNSKTWSLALDFKLKELRNCNTWHRIRENFPLLKMKKWSFIISLF